MRPSSPAAVIAVVVALVVSAAALAAAPVTALPSAAKATRKPSGPAVPRPAAVTTRPSAPKPVAKPTATKAAPKAPRNTASGLGMGSRGPAVLAVQQLLQELKYDVTEPTGVFGDQTQHAVMAFQKVNDLPRTGRVGPQTLAAMETATDPVPLLPDGGADRIEVDLIRQYLGLYQGGVLVKLLSISSGSGKDFCVLDPDTEKTTCDTAVTPPGSFRVRSRIIGWRESRLGLLYNPLYFNGGIAIHGAPSVPGQPASHGCVRIPMISADWFPTAVADGMPVYVFDGIKQVLPLAPRGSTTTIAGQTTTTVPGAAPLPTTTIGGATLLTTTSTTVAAAPVTATTTTLVR